IEDIGKSSKPNTDPTKVQRRYSPSDLDKNNKVDRVFRPKSKSQKNQESKTTTSSTQKAEIEKRRQEFPETQSNTRTPITQKLLDYFAEVMGLPKFTEDLNKGTYISWLQKNGDLGYEVSRSLNSPRRAFDLIAKYDAELAALDNTKQT